MESLFHSLMASKKGKFDSAKVEPRLGMLQSPLEENLKALLRAELNKAPQRWRSSSINYVKGMTMLVGQLVQTEISQQLLDRLP